MSTKSNGTLFIKSAPPLLVFLLLFAVLLGPAGCRRGASEEAKDPTPVASVSVRGVETRRFEDLVRAPGQWRATGEVVVAAPAAGILESLDVRLGDRVASGQVLARLVTRPAQAALRGALLLQREAKSAASRQEAERALELARRELVRVPVTAPRSGVVTRLSAAAGGEVGESAEILVLVPDGGIVFEARVAPADASRLRTGERAVITAADSSSVEAVVTRRLPYAGESDQSDLFWLAPAGAGPLPPIGRFGEARVTIGTRREAPAVPDSAVVEDDLTGASSVAVVGADHRAIWTTIVLGAESADGWREVKSPPLAPGTLVVSDGQRGLPDSTRVQWKP